MMSEKIYYYNYAVSTYDTYFNIVFSHSKKYSELQFGKIIAKVYKKIQTGEGINLDKAYQNLIRLEDLEEVIVKLMQEFGFTKIEYQSYFTDNNESIQIFKEK